MVVRIRPILAAANCVSAHSAQLGDQIPIRSPGCRPNASRPAAMASALCASSLQLQRMPCATDTSASALPQRRAAWSSASPIVISSSAVPPAPCTQLRCGSGVTTAIALGAQGVRSLTELRTLRVGTDQTRPGLLARDQLLRRTASFDPVLKRKHYAAGGTVAGQRNGVLTEFAGTGATCAVMHSGYHEEPHEFTGALGAHLARDIVAIGDGALCRDRRIRPAVIQDQLAATSCKAGKIRAGGVECRSRFRLERPEVTIEVEVRGRPRGRRTHDLLDEAAAERVLDARARRGAENPRIPTCSARRGLPTRKEPEVDLLALGTVGALIDGTKRGDLWRCQAGIGLFAGAR